MHKIYSQTCIFLFGSSSGLMYWIQIPIKGCRAWASTTPVAFHSKLISVGVRLALSVWAWFAFDVRVEAADLRSKAYCRAYWLLLQGALWHSHAHHGSCSYNAQAHHTICHACDYQWTQAAHEWLNKWTEWMNEWSSWMTEWMKFMNDWMNTCLNECPAWYAYEYSVSTIRPRTAPGLQDQKVKAALVQAGRAHLVADDTKLDHG